MVGAAKNWKSEQGKHIVMDIAALCLQMAEWQARTCFERAGFPACPSREIAPTPADSADGQRREAFLSDHLPSGTAERWRRSLTLTWVALGDGGRFRINLSYQRGRRSLAIRRIPSGALDYRKLLIPETVIAWLIRCGDDRGDWRDRHWQDDDPACMLHYINTTMRKHVVTIEDPID